MSPAFFFFSFQVWAPLLQAVTMLKIIDPLWYVWYISDAALTLINGGWSNDDTDISPIKMTMWAPPANLDAPLQTVPPTQTWASIAQETGASVPPTVGALSTSSAVPLATASAQSSNGPTTKKTESGCACNCHQHYQWQVCLLFSLDVFLTVPLGIYAGKIGWRLMKVAWRTISRHTGSAYR